MSWLKKLMGSGHHGGRGGYGGHGKHGGGHHGGSRHGGHGDYRDDRGPYDEMRSVRPGQGASLNMVAICPACDATNAADARFCAACGRAIGPSSCGSCGKPVPAEARFCPSCGVLQARSLSPPR